MKLSTLYIEVKKLLTLDFIDNPSLESRMILSQCLNISEPTLLINMDSIVVSTKQKKIIYSIVKQRQKRKSLSRLLKSKHFFDIELFVNDSVLIPRPETELLVEIVLTKIKSNSHVKILDIGTGSGNIAIALAKHLPFSKIDAIDSSKNALNVCKINIKKNKIPTGQIKLLHKNIFKFIPMPGSYDIIVSNPPYITKDVSKNLITQKVIDDPLISLDGGKDGLDFYRRFADILYDSLTQNGWFVFEHGIGQRDKIKHIFNNIQNIEVECFNDYSDIDRIIGIRKL